MPAAALVWFFVRLQLLPAPIVFLHALVGAQSDDIKPGMRHSTAAAPCPARTSLPCPQRLLNWNALGGSSRQDPRNLTLREGCGLGHAVARGALALLQAKLLLVFAGQSGCLRLSSVALCFLLGQAMTATSPLAALPPDSSNS